jgi:hypothetical protein
VRAPILYIHGWANKPDWYYSVVQKEIAEKTKFVDFIVIKQLVKKFPFSGCL